ncbi:Mak10-domain-containing protein [Ceratobasidium sp. AG-I]|nr:Mak10-domain-containing protein [Ceratobasidium sp. AG-I]
MSAFVDVTEFFDSATAELESGQLLFMPHFSLSDAMSAIEIMDPRMDSALVPPGVTPPEVPFTDPHTPLLAEEVCWILDRTMSAEMGWHSGYALSQTLYTSLYMHQITPVSQQDNIPPYFPSWKYDPSRPIALVSIVLQAGLMAIVKTCDMVWRELNKGYVFDLEDFNADKSEVSLLEGVQIPSVLKQLDKALVWIGRWQTVNNEWQKALHDRISLRKHLLLAVSTPESQTAERTTHVLNALACYHSVRAGAEPPTPPPSSQLHASFDPTINRRLIVNMPLKVIELMPVGDAWKALQSMLEGMLEVCRMTESTNILEIMMLLNLRGRLPSSPNRSAYIRSLNASMLLYKLSPRSGRNSKFMQPLNEDSSVLHLFMPQLVGLPVGRIRALNEWHGGTQNMPISPFELEEATERFLMQHVLSLCYNRPRTRRRMSRDLANWHEIWENAVDIALQVREDAALRDLRRLPLGILHLRLANIVELTFAGFETNLYARSEWPLIYWHMSRVLAQQIQNMTTLSRLLQEDPRSPTSSQDYARSYSTYSKALQSLCYATLLALFARPPKDLDISSLPQSPTVSESLLIERRFKWAFGSHARGTRYNDDARPNLGAWMQFAARTEAREVVEIAEEASKEFKEARLHLLNLMEQSVWKTGGACGQLMHGFLMSCLKVCNVQIPALETLADETDTGGEELNKWTFEHSSWFPTISRLMSNE